MPPRRACQGALGLESQARSEVRRDDCSRGRPDPRASLRRRRAALWRARSIACSRSLAASLNAGGPLRDAEPEADRTGILQQACDPRPASAANRRALCVSAMRTRRVVPRQQGACLLHLQHQHGIGEILAGRAAVQIAGRGVRQLRAQRLQQRNRQRAGEGHRCLRRQESRP